MNHDLMMAVLAINAYEDGIEVSQVGIATKLNVALPEGWEAAGFSARAYSYNGETIISYRGTDGLNDELSDSNAARWPLDSHLHAMQFQVEVRGAL